MSLAEQPAHRKQARRIEEEAIPDRIVRHRNSTFPRAIVEKPRASLAASPHPVSLEHTRRHVRVHLGVSSLFTRGVPIIFGAGPGAPSRKPTSHETRLLSRGPVYL